MKASRQPRFFSSSATTVTYTYQNDDSPTQPHAKTTQISIESDSPPSAAAVAAAVKIQSSYRSYIVRNLVKKIAAANSEASRLERLIQRQETVDAVRADPRERIRMNEALMGLLLRLDSVPGVTPTVRELRRQVSRRIVGLQEILDAVSQERVEDWELGFGWNWVDDIVAKMEEDVCRERGGLEMERFCSGHLGFRCLQRFLRDQ
ncbi:BAG family molecular chaperone regulator 5, mitochondrial [Diospyros lotus]|uniref:BAG family molecular chaperone regulator 5, mitochondrial n=1 Tax=Diospyros lotus TaxID=55363 RepID=UPI00224F4CA9|nr:BAG family molecular chaperone regulator 5, mitochondrial [Diospyros lotus]